MKPAVRDLLRAVVKLADEDIAELRDAMAQIDHRVGDAIVNAQDRHRYIDNRFTDHDRRLADVEAVLADYANHSRKV